MSDVLVFPDARSAVFDLISGAVHAGHEVTAHYQMPVTDYGSAGGPYPLAVVEREPGTQGYVARTARIVVTVYGEGSAPPARVAESIHASLVGANIATPSAYLDELQPDQPPHQLSYYSDTVNQVPFPVMVTTRPVYSFCCLDDLIIPHQDPLLSWGLFCAQNRPS